MSTYVEATKAMTKNYNAAVGDSIARGLLVYIPNSGGQMLSLGDLRAQNMIADCIRGDKPFPNWIYNSDVESFNELYPNFK